MKKGRRGLAENRLIMEQRGSLQFMSQSQRVTQDIQA
jgi:hypothetical protein